MSKSIGGRGPGSQFRPGNNVDKYVRKEIEKTARASAENRFNAIAADGIPVVYYQKTSTGPLCSCQSREHGLLVEEVYPLEDLGEPQSSIEQMIKPAPAFGRRAAATVIDKPVSESDGLSERIRAAGTNRLAFDQGDGVACGICFRTGYESGYQLSSGTRHMLTGRSVDVFGPATDLSQQLPIQVICHNYRPLSVQATSSVSPIGPTYSHVSWYIDLPFVWDSIRIGVFCNDQPVYDSWAVLQLGANYWPLLSGNISSLGSWPTTGTEVGKVYVSSAQPFTHCVLEFETLLDRPVISFPQLSISKLVDDFEGIASLTLEISGRSIGLVKPGDLIFIPRIKKVLSISGPVNRLLTPGLQTPVGWSTEARVIQPVELQTVLQELVDVDSIPFPI
jgi:hypothetical protein